MFNLQSIEIPYEVGAIKFFALLVGSDHRLKPAKMFAPVPFF